MSRNIPSQTFENRLADEPKTISDAQNRLLALREELGKIRAQLTDDNRKSKLNESDDTYQSWRHKAIHARNMKMAQQSRLQQWIQTQRALRAAIALNTQDPIILLGQMLSLFDEMTGVTKVTLSQEAQDLLALVRKITNENPIETQDHE